MASPEHFISDIAVGRMASILALGADGKRFTTRDAMAVTGLGDSATCHYLRYLIAAKDLHRIYAVQSAGRDNRAATYACGPDPSDSERLGIDTERTVIVRKKWPPHHFRGPLECALFGTPAAMQHAQ